MLEMKRTTIGAVGTLFDGPHATPTRRSDGPYFLNIASLKSGRLDLSESDHVSEEDFTRWTRRVTPRHGDLLFSYETRLGEAALMPEGIRACLGRRMALLRPDRSVVDPRFLLYFYLSPSFQRIVAANTIHGATVPRIGLVTMPAWEIGIPDLSTQNAIADLLGALDDKIAANDRTLRLCVELSDAKFAHAVKRIQPGSETFGDIAEVNGGGTPKTSIDEYWNGDILWATPTDITALAGPYLFSTSRTITQAGLNSCSSMLYPEGSILMTSRATIGAFAIAQSSVAVNQGFIVVNARDPRYQFWLFHEMRARISEFVSHANGATFLELSRGKFKQFRVRNPGVELAHSFSRDVRALHAMASQIITESANIATARDELLPLLMSGRICLRDAEKTVEGVV